MTQKDNSDLCEYGRPGRGVGVGIMLAFLAAAGFSGSAHAVPTR